MAGSGFIADVAVVARGVGRKGAAVRVRPEVAYLAGLTLVAAAVRLWGIADKSIWYDEAFVLTLAQMSIPDMIRSLIQLDPHPPLYYLFMHFWVMVSLDPAMVRLPSAVLSTLSVPLLYATGARLTGRSTALAGATILAFAPFHLAWAQETRMYSLLGLLCLGSTYFLIRALEEGGRRCWALHAILSAAGVYTQINAVFYLAAQAAAVLVLAARRRWPRGVVAAWAKSQAGAVLLFVPWLPAFVLQNLAYGDPGLIWTAPNVLQDLVFQFGFAYLPYWRVPYESSLQLPSALVAFSLAISLLGGWSQRRHPMAPLLILLFLGSVGLLALGGLFRGIVLTKTVLPASFAFYLLLAAGLAAQGKRAVLVGGVAAVVALNLFSIAHYYTLGSQESWRSTVSYLEQQERPNEVTLVDASAGMMPLEYYLKLDHRSLDAHGVPFEPWAAVPPPLTQADFGRVEEIVKDKDAVWLVVYRNGLPNPDGDLLPYFASRYGLADSRALTKVRLFKFVPRRPPSSSKADTSKALQVPAATGSASRSNAPGAYLGAWVGARVNVPGDLSEFEEAIGKRLAIVHRYSDNPPYRGKQFDASWADSVRAGGAIPMVSWHPGFGYGAYSLAQVAAGGRDDYIGTWADQLRDWGHPIFFRMMWEQNGPWFSWKATQEPQITDFTAAWRRIVDLFRSHGATNVTFVWSPHVSGAGAGDVMPTYPGDEYVDWVALDGYPYSGGHEDFAETFGGDYELLTSRLSKPIMIGETSLESWSDDLKAERIHDILGNQVPTRFPKVKALVWFDEKDTDGVDLSILKERGPQSRDAFRAEIASHYYASNQYGDLDFAPIPPPDSGDLPQPSEPAVIPPPAPSPNLIADPGFEEGGPNDGWNAAWVVPSWTSSMVRRDDGAAASGRYSMLHSAANGASYAVYQQVAVEPGATYDLSAALSVETSLRYGKATLELQSLNQYGGVIETKTVAAWQDPTDGWARIGGAVRVARGAVKARVQVRVASLRGSFRIDDFSLVRSAR